MTDVSRASSTAGLTIVFCFLAALCEGFDVQSAGVAAGGLSREFKPAAEQLGFFFSAGNLGLFLGAIIGGRVADLAGRKAVLVGSLATFGVFSIGTAFAGSMEALTAMRALTGFGLGGAMPNLIALASEAGAEKSRNASTAMTYIGMPIGGAIASLLVFFAPAEHWRWVFVAGGISPLLIACAMALLMPRPTAPAPVDSSVDAQRAGGTRVLRELLGASRWQPTLGLWVGFFLMQVTLQIMLNWLPLLLQARGLSKNEAAFAQVGFNIGGSMGALLIGIVLDTRNRLSGVVASVIAVPTVLLLLAGSPAQSVLSMGLALLLGGGILALQMILYAVANILYPSVVRGAGLGASVAVGRLGAIAGPAFAAILVGAGRTPTQVLAGVLPVAIGCGICVSLLAWWCFRRARAEASSAEGRAARSAVL
jgi:MFS transporter, AAHS family, 3-hydroxyphenylpropionic acid transporter